MNKKRSPAEIAPRKTASCRKAKVLMSLIFVLMLNASCHKEDAIAPIETDIQTTDNYSVLDYQDTLHIAYAMRTDLYESNNIVFQMKEGGRLELYSYEHLHLDTPSDTAKLVSVDDLSSSHDGVVASIISDDTLNRQYITRGQVIIQHIDDQYSIAILGATENGIGYRCHYNGLVHDLTTLSDQGRLTVGLESLTFHLGILSQDGVERTYRLIGSNPDIECIISSTTDIVGKTLPISDDAHIIENGTAVGLTASMPNGLHIKATTGTLQCSCYGNIYSLVINADTDHGSATVLFTGPIYHTGN